MLSDPVHHPSTAINQIHQHLCAFHFYGDDMTQPVEAHLNEDVRRCLIFDGPDAGAGMTLQLQRSAAVSGNEPEPATGREQEVVAHVYDVACSGPDGNGGGGATVLHINRIFKDAIGLGGIFHTAIQVYGDEEWSFGYCENGSGVFSCPPGKNPMYTFRESIVLGKTSCSLLMVNRIARDLSREWPGASYELLSRNCNHFCNEFCDKLGVPKLPGWVNRFANAGDAALEAAEITAVKLKQAKKEIFTACKAASTYLTGAPSGTPSDVEDTGGSTSNSLFEGTWIRSIIGISMKPSKSLMNDASSSSDDETSDDESESDGKQPGRDQNEDEKDARQEDQSTRSENEPPNHHP